MYLIGETVEHEKFGTGVIESVVNNNALILFGNDRRKISLTYSVGTEILTFYDSMVQKYMLEIIKQEKNREETEACKQPKLNMTEEELRWQKILSTILKREKIRSEEIAIEEEEFDKDGIVITSVHESGHCLMTSYLVTPESVDEAEVTSEGSGSMIWNSIDSSDMETLMVHLAGHAAERLFNPALKTGLGNNSDYTKARKSLKSFYQVNAILFKIFGKMTHPEAHFFEQYEKDKEFFTDLAEDILKENIDALLTLAGELEIRRKMSGDEIREILGRFPVKRDAIKRFRQYVSWYKRKPLLFENKGEEYYQSKELLSA